MFPIKEHIIMSRRYTTFSRTSLPVPPVDIRVNTNQKEPWNVFSQQHKDVLQIYYLVINNILSHSEGIDIDGTRPRIFNLQNH